jgi:predicted MFS family arabinose efflux permease
VLVFGTTGIAAAWSLSTLLPTLVAQAAVPEERGRILGFVHLWWSLAVIVGAMMGGALFEIAPGLPFLISGTANLASLVLLYVFFRLVRAGRLAVGDSHPGT